MEGLFLGGSLLAAFVAGAVALFAPCCVVVMFPSFLAASIRNHRWRLVPLALVFAAGVATVLVPVTLGLRLLTESLLRFHAAVYASGALLLVAMAAVSLSGRSWSLPFLRRSPDLSRTDSAGVFALGIFSGAASACCAPVLAGVLTLSAISPGVISGVAIALAYVFGMVFPLIVMTVLWDRIGPRRSMIGSRPVSFRLGRVRVDTTLTGAAAAAMFLVMAAVLAVIAATGASLAPTFATALGTRIEDILATLLARLTWIPDPVAGALLLAAAIGAVIVSARKTDETATPDDERSCHEQQETTSA